MALLDTVDITKLLLVEQGSTPSTPAATKQKLFVRSSDHVLCLVDSSGTVTAFGAPSLTDPTSSRGEVIRRGAAVLQALQAKTLGKVLIGDGTDVISDYPPGKEWAYAQDTSGTLSVTATTEGTAQAGVTLASTTYDGGKVNFYADAAVWSPASGAANRDIHCVLWDDTAGISLGDMAYHTCETANRAYEALRGFMQITPAAGARVYSVRFWVSVTGGQVFRDTGGAGHYSPLSLRAVKA